MPPNRQIARLGDLIRQSFVSVYIIPSPPHLLPTSPHPSFHFPNYLAYPIPTKVNKSKDRILSFHSLSFLTWPVLRNNQYPSPLMRNSAQLSSAQLGQERRGEERVEWVAWHSSYSTYAISIPASMEGKKHPKMNAAKARIERL